MLETDILLYPEFQKMRFSNLILLFLFFCNVLQASAPVDSLKRLVLSIDSVSDSRRFVQEKINLGIEYTYESQYNTANEIFLSALFHAKKYEVEDLVYMAEMHIASSALSQGKYKLAIKYSNLAMNKIPLDSTYLWGKVLRIIGDAEVFQGNFNQAYEAHMKALGNFKSLKDSSYIARMEFSLGNNFFYQDLFGFSKKHFENALHICQKIGLDEGVYNAYGALGSIHEKEENYEEALRLNQLALEMAQEADDKQGVAWTLLNIGSILCHMDKCQDGMKALKKSKRLGEEMGDVGLIGYVCGAFADIYKQKKNYDKALDCLKQSLEISKSENDRSNIVKLYQEFADIYYQKKEFESFKDYTDKYISLKDSIYHDDMSSSLSNLKQDFELQQMEKEQELELANKESEIQEARMKTNYWIAITIILFGLAFVTIMIWKNHTTKSQNELLHEKNNEILHQNELLRASNRDLEKFAGIISHDLKEPLRNISGFSKLLKKELGNNASQTVEDYLEFIQFGVNQMSQLLTGLLDYSKLNAVDNGERSSVPLMEVLGEVTRELKDQISQTNSIIEFGSDLPDVYFNKPHLKQVLKNLINNAIKFCDKDRPEVIVDVIENKSNYIISVKDNGIGIAEEFREKIFVVFERLHDRKSYVGSGIGLASCKKIIEKHGGQIGVRSVIGEGSVFYFTVPKNSSALIGKSKISSSKSISDEVVEYA